ncbi:MAG: hypothetical protein QXN57_06200 [Desulfurococcaceae archaeon]
MARSIIIQISGIDGSGKTTIAKKLYYMLEREKLPVALTWFRFPYFFSIPLLLLAKVAGLTKTFNCKNKRISIHFFAPLGKVFTVLYVLDFTLYYIVKYRLRTLLPMILISDRGPIDSMVDLLVDIESIRINPLIIDYFIKLQAKGLTISANCNYDTLIARRPEASIDLKFNIRFKLYDLVLLRYRSLLRPIFINTDKYVEENEKILSAMSRILRINYGHLGLSKFVKNKYLKAVLASRLSLIINWAFQGVKIADITENGFRLLLDFTFSVVAFIISGSLSISILALVIAHTINYFINSNGPRIQVVLGKKADVGYSLQAIRDYIKNNTPGQYVEAVVVFGSVIKKSVSKYSDIRVVRKRGINNALFSLLWTMKFRLYMWRHGIPGDIFIATREKLVKTLKPDEIESLQFVWRSQAWRS